ncbi:MAG: hypothetical protein ACLT98_15935 [Eggerthellaceae bacterium]
MLGFVGHLIGLEAEALAVGDGGGRSGRRAEVVPGRARAWLRPGAIDAHASSDYFRRAGAFVFRLCARYAQPSAAFDREGRVFKRNS